MGTGVKVGVISDHNGANPNTDYNFNKTSIRKNNTFCQICANFQQKLLCLEGYQSWHQILTAQGPHCQLECKQCEVGENWLVESLGVKGQCGCHMQSLTGDVNNISHCLPIRRCSLGNTQTCTVTNGISILVRKHWAFLKCKKKKKKKKKTHCGRCAVIIYWRNLQANNMNSVITYAVNCQAETNFNEMQFNEMQNWMDKCWNWLAIGQFKWRIT